MIQSITFLVFTIVASGVFLSVVSIWNRQRFRELAMRERIAMIEKGLVPPPEVDPARFDEIDRIGRFAMHGRMSPSGARYRSVGVMMIGFGLAFVVLLTFAAAEPDAGLGVGGAFVILGIAMFVNGLLLSRTDTAPAREPGRTPPSRPVEPPDNVAP